ncbi:MAG: hypothetical protein HXY24_12270, partial [Rubrivivax sp.]|nr:hypothetical protein [Rubrivivax sp.]
MRYPLGKAKPFFSALALTAILFSAGCIYKLNLQKGSALEVDLRDFQPIAILPIQDAPGYPESGTNLYASAQNLLAKKGYTLINPGKISQAIAELGLTSLKWLSDPSSLIKVNERIEAKLLMIATILEYQVEKSYVRSRDFQVWDGSVYEYWALPTYHQGIFQMRLRLSMLEPVKGSLVWKTEGRVSGPSSFVEALGQK